MNDSIPWERLDPPMIPLVKALNATGFIKTTGCCVGHIDGHPASVLFHVTDRVKWRQLAMKLLRLTCADFSMTVYKRHFIGPDNGLDFDWEIQIFAPLQEVVLKALPVVTQAVEEMSEG